MKIKKPKKPNFSGFLDIFKNLKNLGFLKWVSTSPGLLSCVLKSTVSNETPFRLFIIQL